MNKSIKFHLVSTIINVLSISILLKVHEYVIDTFIDKLFFIRGQENFYFIYITSIFLFSWLATFTIHKFKNYRKHFFVFLFSLLLFQFSLIIYDVFTGLQSGIEYYNSLLDYCLKKSYSILFKEEILITSILISTLIYTNQMIIGKKLLPAKYIK